MDTPRGEQATEVATGPGVISGVVDVGLRKPPSRARSQTAPIRIAV
jgi:hypothetical protein